MTRPWFAIDWFPFPAGAVILGCTLLSLWQVGTRARVAVGPSEIGG